MNNSNETFKNFLDLLVKTDRILGLCKSGISNASRSVQTYDALLKHRERISRKEGKELDYKKIEIEKERARKKEEFAKIELESDFPTLHSFFVITLWNSLEYFIHDLCVYSIRTNRSILQNENFSKIKITFSEYEMLDEDDRVDYVYDHLCEAFRNKPAISKFEDLLSIVGYKPYGEYGAISSTGKRLLIELQNVRNVLVHKSGIVDRKFVENCPWKNATKGEKLSISYSDYFQYNLAVEYYFASLLVRDAIKCGDDYQSLHNDYFNGGRFENLLQE